MISKRCVVNVRTCQKWFTKFRCRDLSLKEKSRPRQPSKIDNVLGSIFKQYSYLTTREIAKEFGIHHKTASYHIKSLGFVLKQSIQVSNNLIKRNLSDHVRLCLSHLIRHNLEPFLDRPITGDEKWILYEDINLTANTEHLLQTKYHKN